MSEPLEEFFEAAAAFCHWAEGAPGTPDEEAQTALRLLVGLYSLAFRLPRESEEKESISVPDEQWQIVFKRFGALPFNYYNTVVDPFDFEKPDLCVGDLADDLADIWRDLKPGLFLYRSGNRKAAACAWHEGFAIHWGRHAADAIWALQRWCR